MFHFLRDNGEIKNNSVFLSPQHSVINDFYKIPHIFYFYPEKAREYFDEKRKKDYINRGLFLITGREYQLWKT